MHFVVVKPHVGLATADVYRSWDSIHPPANQRPGDHPISLAQLVYALRHGDLAQVGRALRNELQSAAAALSPWVDRLAEAFGKLGFVGHQLTGSGAAYFGIARHFHHARRLATILRTRQLGLVLVTSSCP
jgi:4-diphosphocytidyl-2C-methyl-D-erythritol kinase